MPRSPFRLFAVGAHACVATLFLACLPLGADAGTLVRGTHAQYAIGEIDFPSTVAAGKIVGIDAAGDMAGDGTEASDDDPDCVFYNGTTLLDFNQGSGNWCHFTGMNRHGVAVGQYYDFGLYENYAVLYAGGQFSEILGTAVDDLLALNDENVAVANLALDGFAVYDLTTAKIGYKLYDPKEQCGITFPYAINDRGTVLAYDRCHDDRVRYETITRGAFHYFHAPAGFTVTKHDGKPLFNGLDEIPVYAVGSGHVYLWSTSGGSAPVDLGTLPDDPAADYFATVLTDRLAAGVTSDGRAWVWTAKAGMRDLESLVPANSYGLITPEAADARGDLGCVSSANAFVWLYLRGSP